MAQPPQPPQPSFGSRIIQTLTPSWVPDITLFRQTDGEAIASKRNILLVVTTFVAALVFGLGVNPPAEYCKCFKEEHKLCNCAIAIYVWEFIMSEALVTCLLVIKFMVGQYPVRQFIYLLLLCLLIGYWCILTTFIRMSLWVTMLCLCCSPAIFALWLRRGIDQAVERNGGVVGGGIEAGAGHNVASEAGAGGGVEEGAGQNVVVEAGAGGGVGASAGEPAEPAGDEAVGVGELAGVLAGDEAALELAGVLMAKSTIDPCDDLETAEEVSFAANGITGTGMKAFDGVLQSNIMLKTLNLSGNPIVDEGVKCLCDILVNNNGIQKLQLNSTDLGDEGAENIADALKQNRTITTIDLGGNNIHAKGVTAIAEALKDNSVITFLELGYNPMGPDGVKALSEVLKFHGNIETVKLGWCQIGAKGAEFIADMLKYNTTIRVLDLRANGLRNEALILQGEEIIPVVPWDEWWALALKDSSNPQIALLPLHPELRANFNSMEAWEYAQSMSGRPYGYHNMMFSWIDIMADNYPPRLDTHLTAKEVSFAANGITGTGMKAFDGVLQSNIMLKTLNLSGNPIGDEGVKCLCDILVNNNGIQKLQLNSTDLGDEVSLLLSVKASALMSTDTCLQNMQEERIVHE